MEINKTVKMNELIDAYGNLLTAHQKEILEAYYAEDMSLAEIAKEHNVSRNAIFLIIKKCQKILEDYEKKLGLVNKNTELKKILTNKKLTKEEIIKQISKLYR